ncbi:hypothetical protein [Novosphingobium kaempferiae]|uniref:hypothetical protein n=1 Tax=Novosphingobium kaempferiae TaxID=2896849 RepID=UPI001E5781C9|nr:hypothetical protein [Novosphingobium kaempferiae]
MTDTVDTVRPMSAMHASLRLAGGCILGIFGAGLAVGVTMSVIEDGVLRARGGIALGVAAACIAIACWLLLSMRTRFPLPRSPRARRSRIALYLSLGVAFVAGGAAGITGHLTGDGNGFPMLFEHGPISSTLAICAIAGWLIAMGASIYWHLTLDEIERAEYEAGGTLAMYAYLLAAPAWWLAWRGGMAPEPDGVAIFVMVCTVWSLGWAWRRYR